MNTAHVYTAYIHAKFRGHSIGLFWSPLSRVVVVVVVVDIDAQAVCDATVATPGEW